MAGKTEKFVPASSLTDREKQILVSLRQSGVESSTLSRSFHVSTRTIAAFVANATRGAGVFAPVK